MKLWIGTALAIVLTATPASAQTPPAEGAVTRPEWVRKPSGQDIADVVDRTVNSYDRIPVGWAVMSCQVTAAGKLDACRVIVEAPDPGKIGKIALQLSSFFLLKPAMKDGQPIDGGEIVVPIVVAAPGFTPRPTYAPGRPSFVLSPLTGQKPASIRMPCPFDTDKAVVCEAREISWTDTPDLHETAPLILAAQQETGSSTAFCELTAAGLLEKCRMEGKTSPAAVKAMSQTLAQFKAPTLASGGPLATPAVVALIYDWSALTKTARALVADDKRAP
jgi:hypothetical protein